MSWFSLRRRNILHYGAAHFAQDYLDNPMPRIMQDLDSSGLTMQSVAGKKLVVDFRAEGQCNISAAKFIQCLQSLPVSDLLVVYNTVVDVDQLPYRAVSLPTYLVNFAGWFDIMQRSPKVDWIDAKFLCLMRRPSVSRAKLAQQLMSIADVRMSFGSMCQSYELELYKAWLPDSYRPRLLDGFITRDNGKEHDQALPIFKQCLFNIVAESSSQTDTAVWRSQFISEKTYKAFGLRQIPIWWAVPGLVGNVRKLGFDLFDDIVDHSYDQVIDESARLNQVMSVIKDHATQSMTEANQLKLSLRDRFNYNWNLLAKYSSECDTAYSKIEQDFDDS